MNRVNEKIGAWLLEKGHTQKRLAEILGISTVCLGDKISGKTDWTWSQAKTLAGLFDCSLDELAGLAPERTPKVVA